MQCPVMVFRRGDKVSQIARFMGPTWEPPGSCRPQMGPMLAPWTLPLGVCFVYVCVHGCRDLNQCWLVFFGNLCSAISLKICMILLEEIEFGNLFSWYFWNVSRGNELARILCEVFICIFIYLYLTSSLDSSKISAWSTHFWCLNSCVVISPIIYIYIYVYCLLRSNIFSNTSEEM